MTGAHRFRLVSGLVFGLALLCGLIGSAGAQGIDSHTYTVHVRECPGGYSGNDLYGACHGTGVPGLSLIWFPDGKAPSGSGSTDANGDIIFTYDSALLGINMAAAPFDLLTTYAYCINTDTNEQINAKLGHDRNRVSRNRLSL